MAYYPVQDALPAMAAEWGQGFYAAYTKLCHPENYPNGDVGVDVTTPLYCHEGTYGIPALKIAYEHSGVWHGLVSSAASFLPQLGKIVTGAVALFAVVLVIGILSPVVSGLLVAAGRWLKGTKSSLLTKTLAPKVNQNMLSIGTTRIEPPIKKMPIALQRPGPTAPSPSEVDNIAPMPGRKDPSLG